MSAPDKKSRWIIKPRLLAELVLSVIFMLFIYFLLKNTHLGNSLNLCNRQLHVEVILQSLKDDKFELFYDMGNSWNRNNLISHYVTGSNIFQKVEFIFPSDTIPKG